MSLTQIPLESPPPVDRNPAQGDLFDAETWESAYREMHDFPTLLIQARDELAKSRKREAFWISLFAHSVIIVLFLLSPKLAQYFPHRAVMLVQNGPDKNKVTFLDLPPDLQRIKAPPKTTIISDKSRIAESRVPQPSQKELQKLLDASRRGRPGQAAQPTPAQPAAQAAQAPPPQAEPQQTQQQAPPPQVAKLQTPPLASRPNPFATQPMSADRAIEQAAQQAAMNHHRYGDDGDMGLGQRQKNARVGPYEITSDTMGVDFGPYMQRVLHDVKQNWYSIIPESAMPPLLKKGKVTIEFVILKNGQIAGLRYVSGSGDVALDRAAYGGITASTPFPALPTEFGGQYLGLRFTFLYNPDPNSADLQ